MSNIKKEGKKPNIISFSKSELRLLPVTFLRNFVFTIFKLVLKNPTPYPHPQKKPQQNPRPNRKVIPTQGMLFKLTLYIFKTHMSGGIKTSNFLNPK